MTETSVHPVSVMPPPIAEKPRPSLAQRVLNIKLNETIVVGGVINIGLELLECKKEVPQGEWGKWLKDNLNYSQQTATNYMKIALRFGETSKSQDSKTFLNFDFLSFTPSRLLALLALPEGDEQQFVDQMAANGTPIEEMSVRQLQAEIKQYKQDLTKAQDDSKGWRESFDRSQDEIASWKETVANLESRIEYQEEVAAKAQANYEKTDKKNGKLLADIADLQESLDIANSDIAKLTEQLENGKTVIKKVLPADYADLQREVKELRARPVEVAVEKPADYESTKAELEELKGRESTFKVVYSYVRRIQNFFTEANNLRRDMNEEDPYAPAAVKFLLTEYPNSFKTALDDIKAVFSALEKYMPIAQEQNTETVTPFPVAKTSSRAEILHELKQLAADDKTKQTSAKMREIAQEIGVPKSDDMTDEQLITVLKKIKEWKATNEN